MINLERELEATLDLLKNDKANIDEALAREKILKTTVAGRMLILRTMELYKKAGFLQAASASELAVAIGAPAPSFPQPAPAPLALVEPKKRKTR